VNANEASSDPVPEPTSPVAALPSPFWIGCSGWAYSTWKPDFYPQKTPAKALLQYYATQLSSVEVNYTFRQLPSAAIVDGWLAQTGDNFRFSFKAPQRITHMKRLKECTEALSSFYSALLPVVRAGRMGLVLFQLPPNFKADPARLEAFLNEASPQGAAALRIAFEFRHASWFSEPTFDLLRRHQAALCVAESDELETPDIQTAPFSCFRLRKSDYGPDELARIERQLRDKARTGEVFAYMKHEDAPTGALQAAALLHKLRTP
jgi:uncharacterized protein YecE (DUF72 family)